MPDLGLATIGPTTYACGAYCWLSPPGQRTQPETTIHWVREGVVIDHERIDLGLPGSSMASGTSSLNYDSARHHLLEDEARQVRRAFLTDQLTQMLRTFHSDLQQHCAQEPGAANLIGWLESQTLFRAC